MSEHQVIEVAESNTVSDFEDRLQQISEADKDTDLLLPRKLRKRFVGGTAAQLQLIATWRHSCPAGRLRLHAHAAQGEELEQLLERFVRTDHGLAATCLGDLRTRNGDQDLSGPAQPHVEGRLQELQPTEGWHVQGRRVMGVCLDDSSFDFPANLYFSAENPRGQEDFEKLAEQAVDHLWSSTGDENGDELRKPERAHLGTLFCELFGNTHVWARSDARFRKYGPRLSLRGIRLEGLNFDRSEEAALVKEQPTLSAYLEHSELRPRDERRRLVEMTIFDCGPGIASRELARKGYGPNLPPPAIEQEALHSCLEKHFSNDRSDPAKGIGLHESLKCLSRLKALLWVRSGHLSLFRDFVALPYDPERSEREPYLLDWTTGEAAATTMSRAQGTFITALIPITRRSEQTSLPYRA